MKKTIKIEMTVKERWLPSFLGMLELMQSMGSMGCSRTIGFYADGDGDFRPKFKIDSKELKEHETRLPVLQSPQGSSLYKDGVVKKASEQIDCDVFFDAG